MLTRTLAAVLFVASVAPVIAQQAKRPPEARLAGYIPTGIDVAGDTAYVIDGTKVVQVDCTKLAALRTDAARAACYRAHSASGEGRAATE